MAPPTTSFRRQPTPPPLAGPQLRLPRVSLPSLALPFLLLLTSAQPPPPAVTFPSHSDLVGLYSLRSSLALRARNWPFRADPCTAWAGVSCLAGRVVSLDVAGLRRTRLGRLHPQFNVTGIQSLGQLAVFNASGFGLPGPIPAWLNRSALTVLDLSRCSVTGELPISFPRLHVLSLSMNSLSGSLPGELVNASVIYELRLDGNNFSGEISASFWSLPMVQVMNLSSNALTGSLPAGMSPALARDVSGNASVLDLSGNSLYGEIPSGFKTMFQRFMMVDLSGNFFDGEPPAGQNVLVLSNCFVGIPGQRSQVECAEFYARRGLTYSMPPSQPQSPPLPAFVQPANTNGSKRWIYILAAVLGGTLVLLVLVGAAVICCLCLKGRDHGAVRERDAASAPSGDGGRAGGSQIAASVNLAAVGDSFTYDMLVHATDGFGDENLIKHGHSGDLYRGLLEDGSTVVVVKRIGDQIAKNDGYLVELELFSKGRHERLVPFLGHCLDNENEKLLVYRFVRNGDLSSALHRFRSPGQEEEGLKSLDWIKRLKIATGVAEALCYLHHDFSPPMVHRDIQASSILLDDRFEVRLGSLSDVCAEEGDGHHNVITKLLRFSHASEQSSSGLAGAGDGKAGY